MSQQGQGFNNSSAGPRPSRPQSTYGANGNQQSGQGASGPGRGRGELAGRGSKRSVAHVGGRGAALEDQRAPNAGLPEVSAADRPSINFQAPDSNGGVAMQTTAKQASQGSAGGPQVQQEVHLSFGSINPDALAYQQPPPASQPQGRPGSGSGPTQQAMSQQQSQQQSQQHMQRRNSQQHGRGQRQAPPHEAGLYNMQQGSRNVQPAHYNASQNTYLQGAPQGRYNPNYQPNVPYGPAAGYANPMMGGAPYYPNYPQQQQQQQQSGRQSQQPAYQRPALHNRPQGMQQPSASTQPAVPALPTANRPKTKALDIIDPTTHTKVEISPRSTEVANSEHGSAKATPTPSPLKSQAGVRSGELKSGELKSGELKSGELKEAIVADSKADSKAKPVPVTVVAEPAATSQPTESAVALQIDDTKTAANAQPNNIAAQAASSISSARSDTSQQSRDAPSSQPAVAANRQGPQGHAQQRQPQGQQSGPTSTARQAQQGNAQQQPQQAGGRGAGRGQRQQPNPADAQEAAKPFAKAPAAAWGGQKPLNFGKALASKPDKAAEDKRKAEEEAKQKAEEAERKAEADREAEAERKAAEEKQAEQARKAAADKAAAAAKAEQEAEAMAKKEAEAKQQAEKEAAAKQEQQRQEAERVKKQVEEERQKKDRADKEAAEKAAAEAKQKAETEAKQKAETEAKEKAEQAAKEKAEKEADAERKAETERKAEADRQAEADRKAEAVRKAEAEHKQKAEAADKQAAEDKKAAAAKQAAEKEAADKAEQEAANKAKQEADAKTAEKKTEPDPKAAKSEDSSAAAPAPGLSAKQKRKEAMKRAEEKEVAAGYEDPFQAPTKTPVAEAAAPKQAAPQPVPATSGSAAAAEAEEEDDWEEKADQTPRGPALSAGAQASTSGRKVYTLDWLVKQQNLPQCHDMPNVEQYPELLDQNWQARAGPMGMGGFDGPTRVPGGGRHGPIAGRGGRGGPPPGMAPDRWQQQGPLPGMDPRGRGMQGPGPRAGPPGKVENDRWGKRSLPPPPPGMGGGAAGNLPALHQAEKKFKAGVVEGDNVEEVKKQKAIKGLLNKITPEKFDKILQDIIDVGYETEQTESGLIDQVFDKALTETTFCEIYAELCFQLNAKLPSFEPESKDGKKRPTTFRKQLLNKCQEEFDKGAAVMEAVEAREKANEGKPNEEQDMDQAEAAEASGSEEEAPAEAEGQEEGEIVAPQTPADKKAQRLAARRAVLKAADDELKGRRRALGNIQFIGYLYRQKMLTEKIMHECIKKLLADVAAPKQEDLECLTKLMSTVGLQLDNPNAKQSRMYMDAYFERIKMLTKNQSLESRIRFMLQDLVELRWNRWVARREVEGPKKINQVHADARRDDANRARAAAGGPNMRGRGDFNRGPTNLDAYGGPPQRRMPSRHDSMIDSPVRPMQRNSSQEFTSFRPGGGAAPSLRPGGAASGAMQPRSIPTGDTRAPAGAPFRAAASANDEQKRAPDAAPAKVDTPDRLSEEDLDNKLKGRLTEYFSIKDKAAAVEEIQELIPQVESETRIFEQIHILAVAGLRNVDWTAITSLMVLMCTGDKSAFPKSTVDKSTKSLLTRMGAEDVFGDAPKAADWVGDVLGALVGNNVLGLKQLGKYILEAEAEEEPEVLVEGGVANKIMAAALHALARETSQDEMARQWEQSSLHFDVFFPEFEREDKQSVQKKVADLIQKYGLTALATKPDIQPHVQEALAKGDHADVIMDHITKEQGQDALKDPTLVKQIALAVLRHAVQNPKAVSTEQQIAALSPSKASGDLLSVASSKGGIKAEVATILAAQQFFHEAAAPKRLMQRLLEDLVDCSAITYEAIQQWQHDNKDATPGKQEAIKDSAKLVQELAEKDAENTDINN